MPPRPLPPPPDVLARDAHARALSFLQDLALGQFLVDNCFNPNLKCQNVNCKRSARDHMLSFVHNDGRVNITVGWLRFDLSTAALASAGECRGTHQQLTPLGLHSRLGDKLL